MKICQRKLQTFYEVKEEYLRIVFEMIKLKYGSMEKFFPGGILSEAKDGGRTQGQVSDIDRKNVTVRFLPGNEKIYKSCRRRHLFLCENLLTNYDY